MDGREQQQQQQPPGSWSMETMTEDEKQVLVDIRRACFFRGALSGSLLYVGLKAVAPQYELLRRNKFLIPFASIVGSIASVATYGTTATRKILSLENSQLAETKRKQLNELGMTDEQIDARFGVQSQARRDGLRNHLEDVVARKQQHMQQQQQQKQQQQQQQDNSYHQHSEESSTNRTWKDIRDEYQANNNNNKQRTEPQRATIEPPKRQTVAEPSVEPDPYNSGKYGSAGSEFDNGASGERGFVKGGSGVRKNIYGDEIS